MPSGSGTVTRTAVVIPAGGVGARFGSRLPKQFMKLGRVPVVTATVRHFARQPGVTAIAVAAPEAHIARMRRALSAIGGRVPVAVVPGGPTRQDSVWLAMQALAEDRIRVELLAPEPHFWYRPLAVAEPFELGSCNDCDRRRRRSGGLRSPAGHDDLWKLEDRGILSEGLHHEQGDQTEKQPEAHAAHLCLEGVWRVVRAGLLAPGSLRPPAFPGEPSGVVGGPHR